MVPQLDVDVRSRSLVSIGCGDLPKQSRRPRPIVVDNICPAFIFLDELAFLLTAFIEILRDDAAVVVDANGNATFDVGAPELLNRIANDKMRPSAILACRRSCKELADEIVANRCAILFYQQSPR